MGTLLDTPWWVYVLFVLLVIIGLKSLKPRMIPFKRLLILPLVFMIWNVGWLAERLQGHLFPFFFWGIGLGLGAIIGWRTVLFWKIRADRHRKLISIPGNWTTLIFILLVFATRYFFVYNYEMHPATTPHFFIADALVSGVITGIFTGRALELYRKYRAAS